MSTDSASDRVAGPQLDNAQIDWRDSHPSSRLFADVYYDQESGLAESDFVFLRRNNLAERFAAQGPGHFTVAETGFGTGLNFLLTWALWAQQVKRPDAVLHFISVERWPLTPEDLAHSLQAWPQVAPYAQELLAVYPPAVAGFHRLLLGGGRVRLTLLLGDAEQQFARASFTADAWFLDGFAPAKNPDLWTSSLFRLIAQHSAPGTTFSTFSCAGIIRRGLQEQGFQVEKVPGFGRKREMLRGTLGPAAEANIQSSPSLAREAIIIGAGLAGTQAAWNLASRGWKVRIYDGQGVAQGASGNPQGVLYTKLGVEYSPQTRLQLASLLHAQRAYRQLSALASPPFWQPCGVLQLAESAAEQARQQKFLELNRYPADVLQAVSAEHASQLAGTPLPQAGLYFPHSGAVQPGNLCRALLEDIGVEVRPSFIAELHFDPSTQHWNLLDAEERLLDQAPVVILANATAIKAFSQTKDLPLKNIRGQIARFKAPSDLHLKAVVCGEGYVAPPIQGMLCTGATFQHGNSDSQVRPEDHRANLEQLGRLIPDWAPLLQVSDLVDLSGRVGFRSGSPDYLPLIGPLPQSPVTSDSTSNSTSPSTSNGLYSEQTLTNWPGLYATVGHGSKGLATCPLAGEVLADLITGQPLCLEVDLVRAITPGRFLRKRLRQASS